MKSVYLVFFVFSFVYSNVSLNIIESSLKEVSICSFDENYVSCRAFYVDEENIYISEGKETFVIVINHNGEFIGKFGRKGSGPGEFLISDPVGVYNNQIVISDFFQFKFSLFDKKSLQFINSVPYPPGINIYPQFCKGGLISLRFNYIDSNIDGASVVLSDLDDKNKKIINRYEYKLKSNGNGQFTFNADEQQFFTSDYSNFVYIVDPSTSRYHIDMYSIKEDKIKSIDRNYVKIPFSNTEKEIKRVISEHEKYKYSIYQIFADNGYLIVNKAKQVFEEEDLHKFYIDIFKNGEYLGETILDFLNTYNMWYAQKYLYIKNNKVFIYDIDDAILRIYDYVIEVN
ncbi:MAG: hypothetical protein JW870_21520 [Candidatus Delongbacteria bacterium]|nr:hypothetical protein [Candidatus Delongbacteria bacterium]